MKARLGAWVVTGCLAWATPALACSYGGPAPTLESQVPAAASVMIVKVRRLEEAPEGLRGDRSDWMAVAHFDVVEVLKGPIPASHEALVEPTSCDVWLWPGQSFVVLFGKSFTEGKLVKPMVTSFPLGDEESAEQLKQLRILLTGPETP